MTTLEVKYQRELECLPPLKIVDGQLEFLQMFKEFLSRTDFSKAARQKVTFDCPIRFTREVVEKVVLDVRNQYVKTRQIEPLFRVDRYPSGVVYVEVHGAKSAQKSE